MAERSKFPFRTSLFSAVGRSLAPLCGAYGLLIWPILDMGLEFSSCNLKSLFYTHIGILQCHGPIWITFFRHCTTLATLPALYTVRWKCSGSLLWCHGFWVPCLKGYWCWVHVAPASSFQSSSSFPLVFCVTYRCPGILFLFSLNPVRLCYDMAD